MATAITHKWRPPKWLTNPVASTARFHDEDIEVYKGTTKVSFIRLWRQNYRTLLDLEQLFSIKKLKDLHALTDNQIIDYITVQGLHKIQGLASSIKSNGVRVPLVLSYDQELLDGNRRFIACRYLLKTERVERSTFTEVPVLCTSPKITAEIKLKIISELNFLPEYKEEWPREVRARFAVEQFREALETYKDEEKAYKRVSYLLQLTKSEVKRFQAVLEMIGEYADFVEKEGKKARQEAERFGRLKFQFFEEFYNKALSPSRVQGGEAEEYKQLLYRYIRNQQLTSMMKVREFAEIVQFEPSKKHLAKLTGTFKIAKQLYDEHIQKTEVPSRIITFCEWLEELSEVENSQVSPKLVQRLLKAVRKLES